MGFINKYYEPLLDNIMRAYEFIIENKNSIEKTLSNLDLSKDYKIDKKDGMYTITVFNVFKFMVFFSRHTNMVWSQTSDTDVLLKYYSKKNNGRTNVMKPLSKVLPEIIIDFANTREPNFITVEGGNDKKRIKLYQSWSNYLDKKLNQYNVKHVPMGIKLTHVDYKEDDMEDDI